MHGQKDTLIPHQHSIELNRVCPRESYLHLPPDMDHNEFQLIDDLVSPFKQFISQLEAPQRKAAGVSFRPPEATKAATTAAAAEETPSQGQGSS